MAVFEFGLLRLHCDGWGGGGVHLRVSCLWRRNHPFYDAFCEFIEFGIRRSEERVVFYKAVQVDMPMMSIITRLKCGTRAPQRMRHFFEILLLVSTAPI